MTTYTYKSEQGKNETIDTIEAAKKVIIATATTRELNREELMSDKDITKVADTFGIDLSSLSIRRSVDHRDFFYTYSFN